MLSHIQKSVLMQLKGYAAEWRKIVQPATCNSMLACGIMGGPVSHQVLPGRDFTGPFPEGNY